VGFRVNGVEFAHVNDAKDRRQVFRKLNEIAERRRRSCDSQRGHPMIPAVKAKLLEGKKGLIVGIAKRKFDRVGLRQGVPGVRRGARGGLSQRKGKEYVEPLARELEAPIMMPLDVCTPGHMEAIFPRIAKEWGKLDFVVHSIAFSPNGHWRPEPI
jgi:enoyl-[acyl-carrier protein] reductase I